jgi:hypothetical protein
LLEQDNLSRHSGRSRIERGPRGKLDEKPITAPRKPWAAGARTDESPEKQPRMLATTMNSVPAVSYGSALSCSWAAPKPKGKGPASSTISARAEDPAGNYATRSITVIRK